jgi:hypothetical protein
MGWFEFSLNDFALSFLSILFEGVPFLLFGTLVSGFIDAFIPARWIERLVPRNRLLASMAAGLLGFIFPMCECGIVPVLRRLVRKGVPLHAAVTYMLAAPILNPITAVSTYAAFKGQDPLFVTSLRFALGYVIAVGAGWALMNANPVHILNARTRAGMPGPGAVPVNVMIHGQGSSAAPGLAQKMRHAVQCAVGDFLDVAMYLVIGAALTAVFNTAVYRPVIHPYASDVFVGTGVLMGLAFILALCSTSDAFIAATFASFPLAAKLAFLVFGPMFDVKLMFLYTAVFERKFVARLAVCLAAAVMVLCLMVHFRPGPP